MSTFCVDSGRSRVQVRARSSVHDTDTVWNRVTGTIEVNADSVEQARGTVTVDMTSFDAGDWLKNRKLKKDLNPAAHPEATFSIESVDQVSPKGDDSFEARVSGSMTWRGRSTPIQATGTGSIRDGQLHATGSFELDVRTLGVSPPRFLMLKVEDVVSVTVTLVASAS